MLYALLMALFMTLLPACEKQTTPCEYEIPAGYEGWVKIEFNVAGAPPLPVVAGKRLLKISPAGRLQTSSRQEFGTVHWSFFSVDSSGKRNPLVDASRDPLTGPSAGSVRHPEPVVCGTITGAADENGKHRQFEMFYVGRGPAGDPPAF